jgi:hypothetical protein
MLPNVKHKKSPLSFAYLRCHRKDKAKDDRPGRNTVDSRGISRRFTKNSSC